CTLAQAGVTHVFLNRNGLKSHVGLHALTKEPAFERWLSELDRLAGSSTMALYAVPGDRCP
ncbi:MAG: hypothetical protein AAFX94_22145, partial [Myxococcota bacterium]